MFELNFKLQQHTPLIHFQHVQPGVTLRATEVKAKLDKFIRERFLQLSSVKKHPQARDLTNTVSEHFPIPIETPVPSPYRLSIEGKIQNRFLLHSQDIKDNVRQQAAKGLPSDTPLLYLPKTPYFADNEKIRNQKWSDVKLGIFCHDLVGEIFSFHEEVIELMEIALPYFFCLYNFGSRQSKGFGSFTILSVNEVNQNLTPEKFSGMLQEEKGFHFIKKVKQITGKPNLSNHLERISQAINSIYKELKFNPPYNSEIRDYFEEQDIAWEKPFITRELVKDKPSTPTLDYSNKDDRKYVRALLGLAELHDYQQLGVKVKIKDHETKGNIERFESPIIFKVFDGNIFLCAKPVPEIMLDRIFEFSPSDKPGTKMLLRTPSVFNIKEFLENHLK